jgi:2-keto-4-pentenoate hydratase/2-oxohepta-3-ene-1,7-dioic acid hydratase in catechol pathway
MRFVKVLMGQQRRIGVVRADDIVAVSQDVARMEPYFGDDGEALLGVGERIMSDPAYEAPMGELELLSPVDPVSMRDFMVFEEHILPMWRSRGSERGPAVWYERPVGYFSNAAAIIGPRDGVEVPGGSERLDFELEIGAIVGREARSITPEEAPKYLAGYMVLCDWSARDTQTREMEASLGPFKGKDFASSLGPILVTPDELTARRNNKAYDLQMESRVNGRRYGGDTWASASWSFEELLSYSSWNSVVEAGALLGSGTCQGGCIGELSTRHSSAEYPWLVPGDQVTLSVEMLGEITATIGPSARPRWPGFRPVPVDAGQSA